MTDKDIISVQTILSRISSDYFRLADFSWDKHGNDKFPPELMEAISYLGDNLTLISNLIEDIEENQQFLNQKNIIQTIDISTEW